MVDWSKAKELVYKEAGDPHTVLWLWVVNNVLASFIFPARIRTQLLRLCGLKLHPRTIVRGRVIFRSANVTAGPGTVISYGCIFDTREGITIGRNVGIGAGVSFQTSDHDMSDPTRRSGKPRGAPITVGDGARIAVNSTVLPGATIGDGTVIGACSLVRGECEPHSLYVGIPAQKKRDLPR
ncbi:acyltransferase [Klenkia sp. LSe6-5]|uniref:Acyltransferase n=1 Tax=Klenkia sesuvii TaxID=3103137 RepID=A0ABU8DYN8_9ACTN